MATSRFVVDQQGVRYALGTELGRGGQGIVLAVPRRKLAVKLLWSGEQSPARRERLRNQLTLVKRLDLRDVPIAAPLELLRPPDLGYVMELLTGMQPLARLCHPPEGLGGPALLNWYQEGGGLRRRLRLLARVASALAALHGHGLVYGDPSPHNVFVSSAADADEIRLIDADNLRYTSVPGDYVLYTPCYGAPELVLSRSGVNTLTDAHALAVMVFKALTLVHPLCGDRVTEGEPELEDRAMAGQLPWIEHTTDTTNRSRAGLPRDVVLSDRLLELCRECFENGMQDATRRPSVSLWAERLHMATDATLACPACGWSYYVKAATCPRCEAPRPPLLLLRVHLWDPESGALVPGDDGSLRTLCFAVVAAGAPVLLETHLLSGSYGTQDPPCIEAELDGNGLSLRALDGREYVLRTTQGAIRRIGSDPMRLSLSKDRVEWRLHAGPLDRLHRVVRFELPQETSVARR
jgi:DNA-binding helix-hairpin-helix protein with protein kinase domain